MIATQPRGDRMLEVIFVLFLGIATVGTAWCGFQSSQWTGTQTDLAREASDHQVEASRLFTFASQRVAYDVMIVTQYAQAKSDGNEKLVQFYRQTLVRPDFLPTLDRWEATVQAGGHPTNLSEDTNYLNSQLADYQHAVQQAEEASAQSAQAGAYGDDYIVTTILLAVALFFCGVFSSFSYRPARVLLLLATIAIIAVAATRVAALPIA